VAAGEGESQGEQGERRVSYLPRRQRRVDEGVGRSLRRHQQRRLGPRGVGVGVGVDGGGGFGGVLGSQHSRDSEAVGKLPLQRLPTDDGARHVE